MKEQITRIITPLPSPLKNKINKLLVKEVKKRSPVAGKIVEFILKNNIVH